MGEGKDRSGFKVVLLSGLVILVFGAISLMTGFVRENDNAQVMGIILIPSGGLFTALGLKGRQSARKPDR